MKKPNIDRSAVLAETTDVPMPSVENAPATMFRPTKDVGAVDVFEVSLMFLLELTNSPAHFPPGALRNIALSAVRTGELSDSARRFMVEVQQTAELAPRPAPDAAPTGPVQ